MKLTSILDDEFGARPLDLIIDDASHFYVQTRTSFQIAFSRLRPGGVFVIEDWGWAHRPGIFQRTDGHWHNELALSNLIFELQMVACTHPDWFEKIVVLPYMAMFFAGKNKPQGEFSIEKAYLARGRPFGHI